MTHKTVFRLLAALSLIVVIATGVVTAFPGDVSSDWKAVLAWHGNGAAGMEFYEAALEGNLGRVFLWLIGIAFVIFVAATQIGIFFFWRFARLSYAVLAMLMFFYSPFAGLSVMLPLQAALWELALFLDGAIVAMSYLPPINGYFKKNSI